MRVSYSEHPPLPRPGAAPTTFYYIIPTLPQAGEGFYEQIKVISLLQATQGEEQPSTLASKTPEIQPQVADPESTVPPTDLVRLYVAEEQLILKNAYQSFFAGDPRISLLGAANDTSTASLVAAVQQHQPEVMLLGVKALRTAVVDTLESVKDVYPEAAIVLLFAFYDAQGIKALREYSQGTSWGRAYLLKHSIDTVDQLIQVVCSVAQGRIIVDPVVMEQLVRTGDAPSGYLRELSPKALEVLSWMAKGYRNDTIADVLSRDVKTIERHINNIYSTLLETDDETTHPRAPAALMYLKATGLLSTDQLIGE